MQLADVLCYVVLTITVTSSCVGAEEQNELEVSQELKRINKRDATIIVDTGNYPPNRIFQKPKVIYRRISNQRYGPPNPKYAHPRPRPSKLPRKPGKKGRKGKPKLSAPKYGPPISKTKHNSIPNKRASKPKPKYSHPKPKPYPKPNGRPGFGHVLKLPRYNYIAPDNVGFAEPPETHNFVRNYPQKQSYGEPPVDSYGAPLKANAVYPTPQSFQETSEHYDGDDDQWFKHTKTPDTSFAHTKKQPNYANFVTPVDVADDSLDLDKQLMQDNKFFFRKKRPFYFGDSKVVNRPWKPNKQDEFDDEIIVGGKYAEPPARYIAKYPQNSEMYDDDEDEESMTPLQGYVDTDMTFSSNISPYSNYKHSNMAFSPQNLNDAFSIVD